MDSLKNLWPLLRKAASRWSEHNATRLSASVAFYSILSIAPLLILAIAIAGMVFGEEAARGGMVTQIRGLIGDSGADVVQTALANAKKPAAGAIATIIGVLTLLFGASGVFGELHAAMNTIWEVRSKPGRGFLGLLRDKFLSFGMVLSVGFLLLISLVVSAALTGMGTYIGGMAPAMPLLMSAVNFIVSFVVVAGLFALLFRYLPDVRVPWRDVRFGAVVTSLLFTLGRWAIGVYLAKAAVGSPFGAAGSLVAMVVWIYYSALIVFFGAEITQARAEAAGSNVKPIDGAEWIDGHGQSSMPTPPAGSGGQPLQARRMQSGGRG